MSKPRTPCYTFHTIPPSVYIYSRRSIIEIPSSSGFFHRFVSLSGFFTVKFWTTFTVRVLRRTVNPSLGPLGPQ